jgi:hypothetical protein
VPVDLEGGFAIPEMFLGLSTQGKSILVPFQMFWKWGGITVGIEDKLP